MSGLIETWSYSSLKDFEKCPLMAYKKRVERRSTEHMDTTAADRGTLIHGEAENFVLGTGEFTKNLEKRRDYFEEVRQEYQDGTVSVEGEWAFDIDWQPTGWWDDNVWCRMKLDNFRVIEGTVVNEPDINFEEPIVAIGTDYKTGKKYGNEVSHNQQGQLYGIGAFMRYPTLQACDVEFKYLDHNEKIDTKKTYTREKAMVFLPHWVKRATKMTEATDFPPRANKQTCMWCPFGPQNGDGSCEWGV